MPPAPASTVGRSAAIDLVVGKLAPQASLLTRLLRRAGRGQLSRTEIGALLTLLAGPRRITELATTEALAQPTVTELVDRLQARGLVVRERSREDRRVVLVAISTEGRQQLEEARADARELIRETLSEMDDRDLDELVVAAEALEKLTDVLSQEGET